MRFPTSGGGGDFKRVPAGMHVAVCDAVVYVGIQPGGQYGPKEKVYLRFQVPAERITDEAGTDKGPAVIGGFYTASMNEKATLRQLLEGWRGRAFTDQEAGDFDIETVAGKPAMISVVESENAGKTYANIKSIGSLPKGMPAPKAEGNVLVFTGNEAEVYEKLPKFLKDKIDSQIKPEPKAPKAPDHVPGFDDNIGF